MPTITSTGSTLLTCVNRANCDTVYCLTGNKTDVTVLVEQETDSQTILKQYQCCQTQTCTESHLYTGQTSFTRCRPNQVHSV